MIVLAAVLLTSGSLLAKEQTLSLNATVEAGEEHISRLNNLPEGAFLSVGIEIDGQAEILLLDENNLRLPPAIRTSLFTGQTIGKLQFGVRIPVRGAYYLVVSNRQGGAQRRFSLKVTGRTGPRASANTTERGEAVGKSRMDRQMATFAQNLRRYFVFEDLQFRFARCGTANAFSSNDTVIICVEMASVLKELDDKGAAGDILVFAMMHELGHVLLQQWGYPFHDNEEVADEFATVLLVLFNQPARARTTAEFFSKKSSRKELAIKRKQFDRHPLSVQRARNILKWLDDPELLRRWQKVLVPHMQTPVLQAMTLSKKPWIDLPLVERELAMRSE